MTTTIAKILTVFVTFASVAFMAVVMANVSAGGPNWIAKTKELPEVAFDRANPQAPWTVRRRVGPADKADMGGGPILPAAIVSAQKKLLDEQRTEQQALDQKITFQKGVIDTNKAQIAADLDAMKRREADLDKQYVDMQAQLDQISQNSVMESRKQIEDLATLKLRAEEYLRVKNQLEELKAQRESASDELAQLKALLYQAKANLERARTRNKLLQADGAPVDGAAAAQPEEEKPAADSKPADEKKADDKPAEDKLEQKDNE